MNYILSLTQNVNHTCTPLILSIGYALLLEQAQQLGKMSVKKRSADQDHPSSRVISLISDFVDSKDLSAMIFVCKDWKLGLQNAYHVHFDGSHHRDPEALSSFVRFFRACTTVSFYAVKRDDARMEDLPLLLENLKGLHLINCSISTSVVALPLPQLRSLTLTDYLFPGKRLVETLSQWRHLQRLTLQNCIKLKDSDVDDILRQACPALESLTITRSLQLGSPFLLSTETLAGNEQAWSVLSTGTCHLRQLVLRENPMLSFKRTLCLVPTLSDHAPFPTLEYLDLSRTSASNRLVDYFLESKQHRAPQLKTLRLDVCQQLGGSLSLSALPSLQSLSMQFCLRLEHIVLECCPLLQYLDLNCENLKSLRLVSLSALERLSLVMLKHLESIQITNCKVLRVLDVTGCTALSPQWIENEHIVDEIGAHAVILR